MTGAADRPELPVTIKVDNTAATGTSLHRGRDRTINVLFERIGETEKFAVRAWGSAFPDDGAGAYQGTLNIVRNDLQSYIAELREVWVDEFLGYQGPGDARARRFPFADSIDLTNVGRDDALNAVLRRLASAGHKLYQLLFLTGDQGLKEIGRMLTDALRRTQQIIAIHSDELFAPWPMLYVPSSAGTMSENSTALPEFAGFWGYGHLVEHNFKRTPGWSPTISIDGRIRSGLNVDDRLDEEFPVNPVVEPTIRIFDQHSEVTIRNSRQKFEADLLDDAFADQLIYFGCHASVSQHGGFEQPHMTLGDGQPIYSSDFLVWLTNSPLRTNPMVFVNACQGGQLASLLCTSFSQILLKHGANCLLGPQIDIPPAFAAAYAGQIAPQVLRDGVMVGDAVQSITTDLADKFRNPLGLVMSLYRGLDTKFVQRTIT